jgi:hypothetical protein
MWKGAEMELGIKERSMIHFVQTGKKQKERRYNGKRHKVKKHNLFCSKTKRGKKEKEKGRKKRGMFF